MGIDKDTFFKGYSNPVNREIMRIYKDLDMVEQLGSGMPRILSFYKKEDFEFTNNFLRTTFISNVKTTQETIKKLSTKQLVIDLIQEDKNITREALSFKIGVSENAIKQHLSNLKKEGVLKRVGSTKAGY